MKKKIAILASGSGSNAENIIHYFSEKHPDYLFEIFTNNPDAGVIARAESLKVSCMIFDKKLFSTKMTNYWQENGFEWLVLAGFLWLIPQETVAAFPQKIVNIHPALLPAYGGKGMYGNSVHQAVVSAKEKESGITIHFVDEKYDHGKTIFQAKCSLSENETPETLAAKIHALEYEHFPRVLEKLFV